MANVNGYTIEGVYFFCKSMREATKNSIPLKHWIYATWKATNLRFMVWHLYSNRANMNTQKSTNRQTVGAFVLGNPADAVEAQSA